MAHSTPSRDRFPVFSLIPMNQTSENVVLDHRNYHFTTQHSNYHVRGITVMFDPNCAGGLVPSGIGRRRDIVIDRIGMPNTQCSFQIHLRSGEIMLVDESPSSTCRFFDENGDPEGDVDYMQTVVLDPEFNTRLAFGRRYSDYMFVIHWHITPPIDMATWINRWVDPQTGEDGRLGLVRTVRDFGLYRRLNGDETMTRFHFREMILKRKGMKVTKAVDMVSGQHVAIKTVLKIDAIGRKRLVEEAHKKFTDFNHAHVIEFLQIEDQSSYLRLVMDLQDGDVHTLGETNVFKNAQNPFEDGSGIGIPLFRQMLQALDYLTVKGVIHRDVKPRNILYRRIGDSYRYCLADFGVSTLAEPGVVCTNGTPGFKAPEVMFPGRKHPHTHKLDVWSLCATLIWTFDLGRLSGRSYRKILENGFKGTLNGNKFIASSESFVQSIGLYDPVLSGMAQSDPRDRASAGDLLDSLFRGKGRVSGRN